MRRTRLEAFSDGFFAIVITIMVLDFKSPAGTDWSSIQSIFPTLLGYTLSFVFIGIYWANHHHLLHSVDRVNGVMLWANLHLLFWLSLVPFATRWMSESKFASITVAIYGTLLILCGVAFSLLSRSIYRSRPSESELSRVIARSKGKERLSTLLYGLSVPCAFIHPAISCLLFATVSIIWLIPSRELERAIELEQAG